MTGKGRRGGINTMPSGMSIASSSFPQMPGLNADSSSSESEDDQEEENLMAVLLKLSTAKDRMEDNKKRKHYDQVIQSSIEKYKKDVKVHVDKHKKRCNLKINHLAQRSEKLKEYAQNGEQRSKLLTKNIHTLLERYKGDMKSILKEFDDLESEIERNMGANDQEQTQREIEKAKKQIDDKVKELEKLLSKLASEANKEDRFTKLIKTVFASF